MSDDWKAKIQATQLVNRLMGSAMGQIELTAQQIKACEILLRKVAPDLKSVEMSGGLAVTQDDFVKKMAEDK